MSYMYDSKDKVREMFVYHPPMTEERAEKHRRANTAALSFALEAYDLIKDPGLRDKTIHAVQAARMELNQAITAEEFLPTTQK